ncbi:gliding motility lipoprotein GldB [Pseudalgibacter alginicilyticus]|uniref:Gliding motility lipoprotein GldB n=1 Tax=Pseudalgibacter alginicilyticus TaxID=1736674 RepID=A0A0P0CZI9_9FLAO|nr:gliding motility lipoprotein GldB [Pseudalgibacter alginicilyticus]ALJ06065.1 gliding motility lipoprotein GldB [Pseudalgibacter alginicilyticus]
MKNFLLLLLVSMLAFSCKKENPLIRDVADIDISVERFDQLLAKTTTKELPKLKQTYPFMFPEQYTDAFWEARLSDTLQIEILTAVEHVFPNFDTIESDIETFYGYMQHYFPEFTAPRVITAISDVDYRNKVIVTDTIALISIDTYLGSDHYFYAGIQKYIAQNLKREQIVPDLAMAYAEKHIFPKQKKTLLDEMIYFGKALYFKDATLPFIPEEERIGYYKEQLDWALINEESIWRYFVERELLYSTDSKLPNRFINPSPFTKFNLIEIDNDSPGRLGQYIGWQIVRAYMKNNDISLKDMLVASPEEIFNKSRFKPKK